MVHFISIEIVLLIYTVKCTSQSYYNVMLKPFSRIVINLFFLSHLMNKSCSLSDCKMVIAVLSVYIFIHTSYNNSGMQDGCVFTSKDKCYWLHQVFLSALIK